MAVQYHQLLANSLTRAKKIAVHGIVHSEDLARTDLKRLEAEGWLKRIIVRAVQELHAIKNLFLILIVIA